MDGEITLKTNDIYTVEKNIKIESGSDWISIELASGDYNVSLRNTDKGTEHITILKNTVKESDLDLCGSEDVAWYDSSEIKVLVDGKLADKFETVSSTVFVINDGNKNIGIEISIKL